MYPTARSLIWFLLIAAGVVTVLLTFIFRTPAAAVMTGVAVVSMWVGWGVFTGWLFGLRRRVAKHMKRPIDRVTFVSKDVGASRLADYVHTFEALRETQGAARVGADAASPLAQLKTGNIALEQVDWSTIEGEDETLVSVPTNSVYCLTHQGQPFVVKLSTSRRMEAFEHEDAWTTGKGESLEFCASSLDHANQVIRWLSTLTSRHSIYRGQMLQVASPQDGTSGQTIRMTRPPSADRESIVLPDTILQLLQRLVHSRHRHRRQLERYGHHTKLGILLYGPPGTGKTLVTRFVIASCVDHTVIVPSDMAVETLRESFRLAHYLQPSILVIEDVDLLAPNRERHQGVDGLQELMNEMDGLATASDTIVIMSTNRPEALEPALASRPGRVSQTIEFPLPDEEARADLLRLFLRDTVSGESIIDPWAERTVGASPAFLEELCKRAILLASDRLEVTADETVENEGAGKRPAAEVPAAEVPAVEVQFGDMHNAVHELLVMGGSLTSKALGYPEEGQLG